MLVTALTLLAVVRLLRSPDLWSAALVGAACGALALTRAELILLLPALLIPAVLAARSTPVRRKLALLGMGVLMACVVMAPWVARNMASFREVDDALHRRGTCALGSELPTDVLGARISGHGACSVRSVGDPPATNLWCRHMTSISPSSSPSTTPVASRPSCSPDRPALGSLPADPGSTHREPRGAPGSGVAGRSRRLLPDDPVGHSWCGHLPEAPNTPVVPSGACRRAHRGECTGLRPDSLP